MRTPGPITSEQKLFEAAKRILAARGLIVVAGRFVESASRRGVFYLVDLEGGTCSCPDFRNRGAVMGVPCKHLVAVRQATQQAAM